MEGAYRAWMGQPAILRVAAGEMQVALGGKLVDETPEVVRFRIADCLDLHILKSTVLVIEEDVPVRDSVQQGISRSFGASVEN